MVFIILLSVNTQKFSDRNSNVYDCKELASQWALPGVGERHQLSGMVAKSCCLFTNLFPT